MKLFFWINVLFLLWGCSSAPEKRNEAPSLMGKEEKISPPKVEFWIPGWSNQDLLLANSAHNQKNLSEEEKHIFFYTNLARLNGPLFSRTILAPYLQKHPNKRSSWSNSLQGDLLKLPPQKVLRFRGDLYREAKNHAQDMGESGKTGHSSSSGKTYQERMDALENYPYLAENCSYGYKEGLQITLELLIDKGVQNLGHRKNMLSSEYQFLGVSIKPHQLYQHNAVMVFGGE